ncbi:DUF4184 family protein [Micromonospora palythoicola]|uniref:DUF4184 family protein n=1 Tax=Micromonospora palythoicola TaxID=3120507 RepID=UPI002FCE3256
MSSRDHSDFVLGEARRHHLTQVNGVLRRPGMYGRDEVAERLLLEAMAAVDGSLTRWRAECEGLRDRDAFTATGVMGAYSTILPADAVRDAASSVYAEIAHRLGWLELDRALSEAEYQQLSANISYAATLVVSLVIGALTHVLWDSFTHDGMWGAVHIGWLAETHLGTPGYRWIQRMSTVVGALVVVVWLLRWWRRQSPVPEQRPAANRVLMVAAWLTIGLAAVGGAALAAAQDVTPQRMVFLAVTQAGGAGLTAAIVLAAGYAVLARHDQPTR